MEIVMGWPEWIVVILLALKFAENVAKASRYQKNELRAGMILGSIIGLPVWPALLYWGGFFS